MGLEASREALASLCVPSPIGELTLVASETGLRELRLASDRVRLGSASPLGQQSQIAPKGRGSGVSPDFLPPPREGLEDEGRLAGTEAILERAAAQLQAYFAGTRTVFDLQLDLLGTPFQLGVWQALARIPYGETITYGQLAEAAGRPAAIRAAGTACGANPASIIVPCHRVIGANGSLTGYGGGLEAKRFLLDFEASGQVSNRQ